jgi:hypothetical protein
MTELEDRIPIFKFAITFTTALTAGANLYVSRAIGNAMINSTAPDALNLFQVLSEHSQKYVSSRQSSPRFFLSLFFLQGKFLKIFFGAQVHEFNDAALHVRLFWSRSAHRQCIMGHSRRCIGAHSSHECNFHLQACASAHGGRFKRSERGG